MHSKENKKKKSEITSINFRVDLKEKLKEMGVSNLSAYVNEAVQEKIDASTLKDGSGEGQIIILNRKLANAERELRRLKTDDDYVETCRKLKETKGRFLPNLGEALYHVGIVNDPYNWYQDKVYSDLFNVIFKVTNDEWQTIKEKKWLRDWQIDIARNWERYYGLRKAHENFIKQKDAEVEKLRQELLEFMRNH